MKKIMILILSCALLSGCATAFIPVYDGIIDALKTPQKVATIVESDTYWSILFLESPEAMRKNLFEKASNKAKLLYGDDVKLINLNYTGEWNALSLLLYFGMLGQVQDVILTADVVSYVEKNIDTDTETSKNQSPTIMWEADLVQKYDEFNGITFTNSNYLSSHSRFRVYYGERNGNRWLRITANYNGDDWIFYKMIQLVNGDSSRLTINIKSFDKKTDIFSNGRVFESSDDILSDEDGKKLIELLNGTPPIRVRLSGDYNDEFVLENNTVYALANLLNSYYK
jgi:uncharacterized protein YceK